MNEKLTKIFSAAPKVLLGITHVPENISLPVADLRWAISIAIPLSQTIIETIDKAPSKLYKHHYRQVNSLLDQMALAISLTLQEDGMQTLPIPASQIVDWSVPRGDIDHRRVAMKAGLGWIGRHGLLVTPEYGARQRLITILCHEKPELPPALLTTRELPKDGCGKCRACISKCPGKAISDTPEQLNVKACHEVCADFSKRLVGVRICGICIKQCRPKARPSLSQQKDTPERLNRR